MPPYAATVSDPTHAPGLQHPHIEVGEDLGQGQVGWLTAMLPIGTEQSSRRARALLEQPLEVGRAPAAKRDALIDQVRR
jgi:hypothetical protein